MRKRFMVFLFLFLSTPLLHAQVQSIVETSSHTIWIGSSNGLFEITNNTPSLVEQGAFHSLVADGDMVWAATTRGLLRCKRTGCKADSRVKATGVRLLATYDRHLWAATATQLFEILDRKASILAVPATTIESIAVDGAGVVWIAGREFIGRYRGGTFQRIINDSAQVLATGPDGEIWIGSGFEVFRWSNGRANSIQLPQPKGNVRMMPPVKTIWVSSDQQIWIGTGTGLLQWNGKSLSKVLSNVEITSLFEDSSSNLWIGTAHGLKKRTGGKVIDIPWTTAHGNGTAHPEQ